MPRFLSLAWELPCAVGKSEKEKKKKKRKDKTLKNFKMTTAEHFTNYGALQSCGSCLGGTFVKLALPGVLAIGQVGNYPAVS